MTILFLCTGNSARSQMAEGLARQMLRESVICVSAGTKPASTVHPLAVEAMAEIGIDISQQQPKLLGDLALPINLTIAVCSEASKECPAPPAGSEIEAWNLPDPAANPSIDVFRQSRDVIRERLKDLISRRGLEIRSIHTCNRRPRITGAVCITL